MESGNTTDAVGLPHDTVSLVFICFFALLSQALTIGGNILVMLAFRIERRLHKPSNYFLLSLAAADLIIGLFSMPVYSLYLIMGTWPFGSVVCDLWISVDYACSEVSVLNLILISVDRMWSIRSPARYRNKMTLRRAVIMIIPTWVLPILLYFTSVLGWTTFTNTEDPRPHDQCYLPFMQESPLFVTISTVFVYWVPLLAMFIMYANIYCIIRNLSKKKKRSKDKRPSSAPLPRPCPEQLQRISPVPVEPTVLETEAPGMVTDYTTTTTTTTSTNLSAEPFHQPETSRAGLMPINDVRRSKSGDDSCMESSDETSSSERRGDSTMSACSTGRNNAVDLKGMTRNNNRSPKPSSLKRGHHGGSMSGSKRGFRRTRSQRGERQSRSERKATRTLTFILGAFFITWSPYSIMVIIMAWCETCVPLALYNFSYYFCYINSTINPLCYAFANELFRASFHKILTCKTCRG